MIDETVTMKCFLRIIFFWVRHHLGFSLRLSSREVSWSIDMYDSKGWEIEVIKNRKNLCKKNVEISFFNIGNILLLYLSVSNTTNLDFSRNVLDSHYLYLLGVTIEKEKKVFSTP